MHIEEGYDIAKNQKDLMVWLRNLIRSHFQTAKNVKCVRVTQDREPFESVYKVTFTLGQSETVHALDFATTMYDRDTLVATSPIGEFTLLVN